MLPAEKLWSRGIYDSDKGSLELPLMGEGERTVGEAYISGLVGRGFVICPMSQIDNGEGSSGLESP